MQKKLIDEKETIEMFDKNQFKGIFRSWAENNPFLDKEDALEFCHRIIPTPLLKQNYWLIEQSIAWFQWVKEQRLQRREEEQWINSPIDEQLYQ